MELTSLHPFDPATVAAYVGAVAGGEAPEGLLPGAPRWAAETVATARLGHERARRGEEAGANAVSLGLARVLAATGPTFLVAGLGLTGLEARVDRGVGMLLRPPSRLFGEAGLENGAARAMPIRLDLSGGLMGGAFVPPRLVPDLARLLDERSARFLRRLAEAEFEAVATLGLLVEAATYARERGLGLYEAMDALGPAGEGIPGARVLLPDRARLDPALRRRLEEEAKPPKKPGLLARVLGRGRPAGSTNGRTPLG